MERISFILLVDNDGKITVKNTMLYIMENVQTAQNVLKTADNKHMKALIQFIESHPDNTDARIIKSGTMEEILQYIA